MNTQSPSIHPQFKLNGLAISSAEELLNFADSLTKEGTDFEISVGRFLEQWLNFDPAITLTTSGSTGAPKTIELFKEAMVHSAQATGSYFKLGAGTRALLCLSADYIAGKMMLVRAMTLGWDLHIVAPAKDSLVEYDNDYDFVAMVPYQVYHSIEALDKVKKLIIGGGVVSAELEDRLQSKQTEVFATYGMTETISHVAVRRLNGFARTEVYSALPGIQFETDQRGCLVIHAPKLNPNPVVTNDLVQLESGVAFKWMGRLDNVVNSGGHKLIPEVIEAKISDLISGRFIIAAEPDPLLGERLILVLERNPGDPTPDINRVFQVLDPYERPKKIYSASRFPMTATQKIKRDRLLEYIREGRAGSSMD